MKKLITIIFCLIAFSAYSFAQFTQYLPTEKLDKAREEAAKVLEDPQLVSLATVTGILPGLEFNSVPIPIAFNIDGDDMGKSTGWVYIFNSPFESDNYQAIAVGSMGIIDFPINLTALGTDLGTLDDNITNVVLDDHTWLNSNEMLNYLKASEPYTNFMTLYPTGYPKYIVLGHVDSIGLAPNTPYWFVTMSSETDSIVIVVNALNGVIMDVEDEISNISDLIVYPNPAQDFVMIQMNSNNNWENYSAKLFDNIGQQVITKQRLTGTNSMLDLRNLVNGKYFLHVNSGKNNKIFPIVISR